LHYWKKCDIIDRDFSESILPSDENACKCKTLEGKTLHKLREEDSMEIVIIVVLVVFVVLYVKDSLRYTEEEKQMMGTVMNCKKGEFHEDQYYLNLASTAFMQKDYGMHAMYLAKAKQEGQYDYHVTVKVDGEEHVVVRGKPKEVGEQISVKKIDTYKDGEWLETEYK